MRQVDSIPYNQPLKLKRTIAPVFVYLATPIKHHDPNVEADRCDYATEIASYFHDASIPVFSPATHGAPINKRSAKRQDWQYWSKIDLPILMTCCTHLVVICSPGWVDSTGVSSEISTAGDIGIPVLYFDPFSDSQFKSIIDTLLAAVVSYKPSSVRELDSFTLEHIALYLEKEAPGWRGLACDGEGCLNRLAEEIRAKKGESVNG